MSEILRVDRVEVVRWGRASGFRLNLPKQGFVVLYGPNESGKTSLATALAWLIAGPGTQGTLQRFGTAGETLEASLEGRFEASPLFLRARAKVTRQSSGSTARETLKATIGQTSLSRRGDLNARFGGGDFDGYRRLYWVEALEVANGSNLQEDVSVKAVFGGVNPFTEAASLANSSQELLGALKGRARAGSARQLQTGLEALDREMRSLAGAKDDWGRIETELAAKNRQRERLESELREQEGELRSVQLALQAVTDGVAANRDRASSILADTPEPSAADRRIHEQLTTARARIGELRAAESEEEATRLAYESDSSALDDNWCQMVAAVALGEPGIEAADHAETRYRVDRDKAEEATTERASASARHQRLSDESEGLRTQWTQRYRRVSPEAVVGASRARTSQAAAGRVASGAAPIRPPGRALGLAGILLGTGCGVAAAVLAVARGDWVLALVTGLAAAALVVVTYRAVRSRSRPLDPEQLRLAERIQDARAEQDDANRKLSEAETEVDKQKRRADRALQEYQRSLAAVGVQEGMIERYSPHVVSHLKAVSRAQRALASWKRAQETAVARLDDVRSLLLGLSDASDAAATSGAVTIDRANAAAADSGQGDGQSGGRDASVHVPAIQHATGAEALLEAACARVDQHSATAKDAQEADDALKRAVKHDSAALAHIEEAKPGDLQTEESRIQAVCRDLETELSGIKHQITDLEVKKRALESAENRAVELTLERGTQATRVEKLLVRGLAHHLAATLLHDAAERHRLEQQPGLLRRTQELACEVADWTNITVNPHAPTTRRSTGTDNMLVRGPRGEHSDQRLSLGAQTLLYLALRLATVEEQAEARGVRLPLILDDVLVGLDDERAGRCLEVLAKFAERHQMILLTCHESTMQRAKAAGAIVLPIPPT